MLSTDKVLGYLSDVAGLGQGPQVMYEELPGRWEVSLDEVRKGSLDAGLVRQMLAAQGARYPRDVSATVGMRLPVALVSVRRTDESEGLAEPLLMLAADLDAHGRLQPVEGSRALIPADRLRADGVRNRTLCVCDLDTYRAHQRALDALPSDGTWESEVARALDLFAAVSTISAETLAETGYELLEQTCVLMACDHPSLASPVARILRDASLLDAAVSEPARKFLGLATDADEDATDKDEDAGEVLPDDELLDHKIVCGNPGHLARQSADVRAALASFARQQEGDLMAVRAPAATGAEVLALSSMANLLVERALRGEMAPHMACVAPPHRLRRVLAALESRPTYGQTAVPTRWLPRIARGVSGPFGEATGQRTLGSLGALALVRTAEGDGVGESPAALFEWAAHPEDGDVARHSDAWYVPKATLHFLDCASSFLGHRVRDLGEAHTLLSERLRLIDQDRCELVDAYAGVCVAAEQMRARDEVVVRLGRLRHEHTVAHERLVFWQEVTAKHPPKRSFLSRTAPDQTKLIVRLAEKGERAAQGCTLVEQVCAAYRAELERIESEIDRLRGASARLAQRVRSASPAGTLCSQIIARLVASCGLNPTQAEALESVMDGHDTSFAYLDDMLDQTVRAAEFWVAVHVFEARWLVACQAGNDEAASLLCPFELLTPSIAVAQVAGGRRFDLAVLLDAEELGVGEATALLTGSSRALVVGSEAGLRQLPAFGLTSGALHATALLGDVDADELAHRHLASWTTGGAFEVAWAAEKAARAQLTETRLGGVELADVRSALVSDERVWVGDDVDASPMVQALPALSHVLVPDSAWGQLGASRRNRAEALAVRRWVANHADELEALRAVACEGGRVGAPVLVTSPYEAQARLLREVMGYQPDLPAGLVEVRWLPEAHGGSWPVVVLCATCGPEALDEDSAGGTRAVLAEATGIAGDAIVLFCGGSWAQAKNGAAHSFMRRSLRVGRLFSVSRGRRAKPAYAQQAQDDKAAGEGQLRSKPLSLTGLLTLMQTMGELERVPSTSEANRALASVGLIERVATERGTHGWRPTAAGREAGIVATSDRNGNPFCSYTPASMPVVASIVSSLDVADEQA